MKTHKEDLLEQAEYGLDFIERTLDVDEKEYSELRVIINIYDVAYVTLNKYPGRQLVCTKDGIDAWVGGKLVEVNMADIDAYAWLISKSVVINN